MKMGKCIFACTLLVCTPTFAQVAPPVGNATGEFFYEPLSGPGVIEDGDGEKLYIGPWSAPGSYTLSTGETLTLLPGSNPLGGRETRPSIINGGAPGGVGTIALSNGSTIELLGDNGSPTVFIGEFGGVGTFTLESGSSLRLFDDTVLAEDQDNGERGVYVTVGDNGTGSLSLDASSVEFDSSLQTQLFVGSGSGTATLTLSNGSTLSMFQSDAPGGSSGESFLFVGEAGSTGTMTVSDSTVNMGSDSASLLFRVGTFEGANATLSVEEGSTINIDGARSEFFVGRDAVGSATFDDSSSLTVISRETGEDSLLFLGFGGAASSGTMNVLGGSTISVGDASSNGVVFVGDRSPDAGESTAGSLTVSGTGSQFTSSGDISVGSLGGDGSSTGLLTVSSGGVIQSPLVRVGTGGTLSGAGGTILGDVQVFDGGLVAPGTSPGILSIDGDFLIEGGAIEWEIGASDQDIINVTGDIVAISAFDLIISFIDGYIPLVGSEFSLFGDSVVSDSFGEFARVSFFGASPEIDLSALGSGRIAVTGVSPVPLPAGLPLLLAGLAGLAVVRRTAKA